MNTSPQTLQPENRDAQEQRIQPDQSARFCKIVTFYEDFDDAIRAVQNHENIMRTFSNGRHVISTSWSFQMLGQPELNSVILNDASHASVIVVANHGRYELPERVASWVSMLMAANPYEKPVLLALHDERLEADGLAAPFCTKLQGIAGRTNAPFMCIRDIAEHSVEQEQPDADSDGHDHVHSIREAERYQTTDCIRWWGINE